MSETVLIYTLTGIFALLVLVPYLIKFRRQQIENYQRRKEAEELGVIKPRSQYPMIDQSLCIGCGSCVRACPEGDVLGVVFGKAMIINGLRCIGHGHCEPACPVGAIRVGLGDITTRDDIPILDENYQSTVPGLYIAGELGGISLIRNAINQGRIAVMAIARSLPPKRDKSILDVIIIGAGPAGLTAALTAKQHQLSYLVIDQQSPGGTILQYPRRKLVMTQPAVIPLYGKLTKSEYTKEELLDIWQEIITKFQLQIHTGERLTGVFPVGGGFEVVTNRGSYFARKVVLAMGRRGTPRKLNVPGEDLPKVAYQLIDAQSYQRSQILVVGGGDSAVEAAIALARQPGNKVYISYRKSQFFRIKKKNEERIQRLIKEHKVIPIFDSNVVKIEQNVVQIRQKDAMVELPNDFVFIFAGGIPPFKLLKDMGIRFGGEAKPLVEHLQNSPSS
jgi:putative YpdA family bacillithiol system oxidoreductase